MGAIIIRYGEIWLKGRNKSFFENKLIKNIKNFLKQNKINFTVKKFRSRILIYTNKKIPNLKYIFGITSFSYAKEINLDLEDIKKEAVNLCRKGKTFRVTAKRLAKDINLKSQKINEIIGECIIKKLKLKVNLENPGQNICIEIFNKKAYIFNNNKNTAKCYAGLPVGVSGLCTLILEDKSSLLAGVLMLKRGCSLEIINKNKINYKLLKKFSYGTKIKIVKSPNRYSYAIIVNDTLENYKKRKYRTMILRPLISFKKENIKKYIKYYNII